MVAQILAFMAFVVTVPLIGTAMVPIDSEPRFPDACDRSRAREYGAHRDGEIHHNGACEGCLNGWRCVLIQCVRMGDGVKYPGSRIQVTPDSAIRDRVLPPERCIHAQEARGK